jgi:hypothetical protein
MCHNIVCVFHEFNEISSTKIIQPSTRSQSKRRKNKIKKIHSTSLSVLHNILEPTMRVTFFNSGFKSDPTELFPSIVSSIVISKFLHCTILVTISAKELLPTKLQFKVDKNPTWRGSWMLLDALFLVVKGLLAHP